MKRTFSIGILLALNLTVPMPGQAQKKPPVYEFVKCCKGLFGYDHVEKEIIGDNHYRITCMGRGFIKCRPSLVAPPGDLLGSNLDELHKLQVENRIYELLDEIDLKVEKGQKRGSHQEKLAIDPSDLRRGLILIRAEWKEDRETSELHVQIQVNQLPDVQSH
ncbi:MAG: hypothetical protein EP338_01560 [Bacteroidetes bacterium]|nr:MAG: hypothetical protein EP338_01560 [Bacteroidota bacterium]